MSTSADFGTNSKLEEFFQTALKEIYWSEKHLANVLSSMKNAATNGELINSFERHREETLTHAERLENVFELLEMAPEAKHSKGLQGIFDEGWQVIDETDEGSAQRDVALIIAAQKVEHYEIACYGSLITLARTMNRLEIAELLIPTLNEEKQTDLLLTEIAESGINQEASNEEPVAQSDASFSTTDDHEDDASFNKRGPEYEAEIRSGASYESMNQPVKASENNEVGTA